MPPMNTHQKYHTISHHHFDFMYARENGEFDYPHSALMLVECADGRWFIEQEFGEEYDRFPGVVKSGKDLETAPTFYLDVDKVARAAFALIKQVYPGTPDERLAEFLED